jgi:hypothetical protein
MVLAFLRYCLGELLIDLLVMAPMQRFEQGPFELQVAQRPQRAVGKAIVKSADLCLA